VKARAAFVMDQENALPNLHLPRQWLAAAQDLKNQALR
jgi:hypothetical protein